VATYYFRIQSSFILKIEVTSGFLLTIAKAPKHGIWLPGEESTERLEFIIFHAYLRNKKKITRNFTTYSFQMIQSQWQ
jgi:hypothetical protein